MFISYYGPISYSIYLCCVSLNIVQIDRLYEWKKAPNVQVEDTIKNLTRITKQEFEERSNLIISQLAEQVYKSYLKI